MNLTNKRNFPAPLFAAIKNISLKYQKGAAKYSITELTEPAQLKRLEKLHWDELEEDIADRFWSASSQAFHYLMQYSGMTGEREVRYFGELSGIRLSGQVDFFDPKLLEMTDYKETSVWKIIFALEKNNGIPLEWEEQINGYAMLMRMNGREVKSASVLVKLRDWMISKAMGDPSYPQAAGLLLNIPLWSQEKCIAFFEGRVAAHEAPVPAECSASEMWEKPTIYAVMKKGQKKAVKGGLYTDRAAAEARVAEDPKHFLQPRPGKRTRCENGYCPVAKFCKQFAAYRAKAAGHAALAALWSNPVTTTTGPLITELAIEPPVSRAAKRKLTGQTRVRPQRTKSRLAKVISIKKGKRKK